MISLIAAVAILQRSPIRVACVGDSITAGWGLPDPNTQSYPAQLAKMLGTGYEVGNFGHSGATLVESSDYPYWNKREFERSKAFAPNVVVIMLGTNDATVARWPKLKNQFVPDYKRLIRIYADLPSHPKVYACIPVPAFDERTPQIDFGVVPLVKQAARESGADTIDLYSPLAGKGDLFPDHLHPNPAGAGIMAETVAQAIEDARGRKSSWRLVSFDSEEAGEGRAKAAIDGDPYTYWHTNYSDKETRPPHQLVVDMGTVERVKAFRYLPRQDGGINGRVKDFELYLSVDGKDWGTPVVKSTIKDAAGWSRFDFNPQEARFFKFVALSEQHNNAWTSAAELDLVRSLP